jgi:predicted RNA-binding Zn-ribbon protein involved in translation (DUF1610 family)
LKIRQVVEKWDYKSLSCGNVFNSEQEIVCPKCAASVIATAGKVRGKQLYKCKSCLYRFQISTAFVEYPELKDAVIRLGVCSSMTYGFLFLNPQNPYLFPGQGGNGCLSRTTAKQILALLNNGRNQAGIGTSQNLK